MRNIKLVIEYDGTNFSGWQEQRGSVRPCVAREETCQTSWHATAPDPNKELGRSVRIGRMPLHGAAGPVPTVQAYLREAVHKVAGEWVAIYGASRTDAGVHALGQVANFKTSSKLPVERFVPALNYYLPREIVVRCAEEVTAEFHAQYSARSKVYRYTILNDPIAKAINRNLYYHFPWPINLESMREAARGLLGKHSFKAFCVEASSKANTIRTIKSFEIIKEDLPAACGSGRYLYLVVEADGFLYKMIRGIVGTLLLVGSGKMGIAEFKRVVESRDRCLAGSTAPAKGLCLLKVNYEEDGAWRGK
ncbi:MAG TPA: tRNA pseudouridine(38-40) synthase TruA [Candidatus Hypogeohydataceae bacterium YC41]